MAGSNDVKNVNNDAQNEIQEPLLENDPEKKLTQAEFYKKTREFLLPYVFCFLSKLSRVTRGSYIHYSLSTKRIPCSC